MVIESASTGTSSTSASPPTERSTPSTTGPAGLQTDQVDAPSPTKTLIETEEEHVGTTTSGHFQHQPHHHYSDSYNGPPHGLEGLHPHQQHLQHQTYTAPQGHHSYYGHDQGQDNNALLLQQQQLQYPMMNSVHPLNQIHPLHPNHFLQTDVRPSQAAYYPGMNVLAPSLFLPSGTEKEASHGPEDDTQALHYGSEYHYSSKLGQIQENQHTLTDNPPGEQNGARYRNSLPSFPPGHSRSDYGTSSSPSSVAFMQSYSPGTEGPVIHHRNSIAGTTLPHPVVRSRRAGSLAAVEDGPYFANTRQFHNVYSMDQTQSYKFRVMARIDRGFFTASKIWTCYRRNYFQISTAFNILGFDYARDSEVPCLLDTTEVYPRDPEDPDGGHIHGYKRGGTNTGHLSVVTHFSVCISSKISSSDKKIDLIQHTPKRDKGPQNVPGLRQIKGGGALTVLSDPSSPSGSSNGSNHNSSSSSTSTTPQSVVTYERVQFKTATANNGKRQAAQQFYILLVDLYAHTENGDIYCVASSQSDALVVRGRSPGHYVDLPERSLSISSLSGLEGTIGGAVVTPTSSHVASPGERRFSNVSQHGNHPYYYHHHHQHSYSTPHSRTHSISAGVGSMSIDVSSSPLSGLFGPAGVAARERRMTGGPLSPLTPLSPMSPAAIDGFGNQSEVSSAGGTLIGGTPTTVNNDDKYSPGVVGVTGEASSAGLNPAQSYFQYPTYQAWTEQEQLHGPLRHYQHSNSQQSLHRHFHGQHQQIPIGDPSLSTTSSNYDYDSSSFSSPTTPYPTGYSTSYPTTPFSGIPVNHSSTIGSVGPTVAAAMNGGLSSAVANTTVSESIAAGTPYPHWNGYPH